MEEQFGRTLIICIKTGQSSTGIREMEMIKDIKLLAELYLHARQLLPEVKLWSDFHNEIDQDAPLDGIRLLADAKKPKRGV